MRPELPIEFNNPHALWLVLLVPVYLYWAHRRIGTCAVRYPSVRNLKTLPRSFRQQCRFLMPALRGLALLLLIVVLARPLARVKGMQAPPSQGIGIAILVDRSGSMGEPANKLMYDGKLTLRFDAAKDAVRKFVEGDGKTLKGRPNDQIGLLTFATYPQMDHPFTLDHASLVGVMDKMSAEKPFLDKYGKPTDDQSQIVPLTDEQGRPVRDAWGRMLPRTNPMQFTSLKSAIEYTARKLILFAEDLKRPSKLQTYNLKSKVMVLLTDGEPTVADQRQAPDFPDEATVKMLTDNGIKVYFIQILSRERYRERPDGTVEVIVPRQGGMLGQMQADQEATMANQAIEEARKLTRRTGGEHFLATTGDQIKDIYAKIDKLERSDVGGRTVFSHEERYRPYLFTALAMLAGEVLLTATWLRRAP